jgi:putative ABC transport system permease protein
MESLLLDLRLAIRSLGRRPGFAAGVVLTLAVGIGINVAFAGYLGYFVWPTIDAPEPERIVRLHTGTAQDPSGANSYPDWLDIQASNEVFSPLVAYRAFGSALATREKTLHAWGTAVSGDYFQLFGKKAHAGRLIEASDDRPGAERVLVLNHFFWRKHFGSDLGILGQVVQLDAKRTYRIVGITTAGFQGDGLATSIYVPLATAEGLLRRIDQRDSRGLQGLARLRSGVSLATARAAMVAIGRGLDEAHPESEPRQLRLAPITEANPAYLAEPAVVAAKGLMAAVGLLLLLACANVANLMLARSVSRRRELGIHAALGASRLRIGRRLLAESVLLSTLGGILGLGLARAITKVIEAYLLLGVPVGMGDFSAGSTLIADARTMTLFFLAVCLGTGVLVGLAPLSHALRQNLVLALKSDGQGDRPGRKLGLRQLLVVTQVALSVVLLLAAGLLLRSFWTVRGLDLGFDARGLTLITLHMPTERSRDSLAAQRIYHEVVERVRALPGVSGVGTAWRVPTSNLFSGDRVSFPHSRETADVNLNVIGPGYFETLGIELLAGRTLNADDRQGAPGAVVINQAAAEKFFPGRSAVGGRLTIARDESGGDGNYEIVGVAPSTRDARLTDPIQPLLYFSAAQRFRNRMTLIVRATGSPARPLAELLRQSFPDLAVVDLQPFAEQLRRSGADQRMNADLASGFGFLGLALAGLGIFGVMSYTVSRSGRDIGVRMALGATARDIRRWVLRGAGKLVAAGLALGVAATWALSRLLASMLHGVSPRDPATLFAVVAILGAVAFVAALVPALRAARIQPVRALRDE